MKLLVTGGMGFIGSNFIRILLDADPDCGIVNLDLQTYAGNPRNLEDITGNPRYSFIHGDICDTGSVENIFREHHFDAVVHFAADSHVDRSLTDPSIFVRTNVLGTHVLLEAARKNAVSRFIHVSTDEVYGSTPEGAFLETDRLNPSSPYSASKAGSDLLAQSYFTTYGLPVIITRCTNNFGPYQFPEKLIPFFVTNLIEGKKVPVYGTGKNIRDWIHVADHCRAVAFLLRQGTSGEIYNIGGGNEWTNIEITGKILGILNRDKSFVEFIADRPGHDFRYSLDCSKLASLGWKPAQSFDDGLRETVDWYVRNEGWWRPLKK